MPKADQDEATPDARLGEQVRRFYEAHPFPDYEDVDSPRVLRERAARSQFARLLDEHIPLHGATLEAGCGTGQMTNFLALARRRVVGLDFCAASLELARGFRDRFGVARAHFVQGDVFAPPFPPGAFHTVVSLGVLHHTPDPERAFRALVEVLMPGGHFVLGLYSRYARLPSKARGVVIRALGVKLARKLDGIVRHDRGNERRRTAWLNDQYFHVLEKTHTVREVLRWFDGAGVDYVNAVPKIVLGEAFRPDEDLFEPGVRGTGLDHVLSQCGWIFTHGREGGLFVLIGRKR